MTVGRVRRSHGVRGAWVVEVLTEAPGAVFAPGAVLIAGDTDGERAPEGELHVIDGRPMNRDWLVRVQEVTDRDVAGLWRGRYLLAEPSNLPPPGEGQVYNHELPGMQVQVEGRSAGVVSDVYTAPQGLIIEVDTGKEHRLVPWHPDIVRGVDRSARTIELIYLQGLLD